MNKKRKASLPQPVPAKPRNKIQVVVCQGENTDDVIARTLTRPEINAATAIQKLQGNNHEVNALARELSAQVAAVNNGDLKRAEGMLIAQAHTLDELFNNLVRRSSSNMQEYLQAAEIYMRLALKAQSQCRATLETLVTIKNPPIVFARQANIAQGPQQVNNGVPVPSRAGNSENPSNEILEAKAHERLDTEATGTAGKSYTPMETVGSGNRP